MKRLSPYELGMLASSMSPGSAARMMGRTEAWVIRTRAALAELDAEPEPDHPAPVPEPDPAPVAAPVMPPPAPAKSPSRPAPASAWPGPSAPKRWSVSARKLRFCRWFLAAGWSLAETAHLFDLYADELEAALAA